ncbi:hypothetical protein Snoj_00360 [Streptomyces nojiriensis]|uniref:Uncharacterized protein n=1 Tax=Streptomyces nojiriensis TaxID=66374 RepID=A0ABQ3SDB4_9ACTN|nr:DUF6193 family natural product biosynthesis protein [Streptomyces nojiriensis]QTI42268.1 hypothetical protein JYK04_00025 [Streptomyces nojiriensis]GGS34899.1 hypothetical protein GCM10010205_76420 [Streptomyces nojiriensis]GHI66118.1 hypothetical protein Snoj_00360 [Streptomyces nojiriensis]
MSEETPPTPGPVLWYPVDGLGDSVEARWQRLRERIGVQDLSGIRELVEAAFAEPRLRVLSPGTSAYWLRFSRRATPPICFDLPLVRPLGNDHYEVRTSDGGLQEAAGAREAISLVVAALPADVRTQL